MYTPVFKCSCLLKEFVDKITLALINWIQELHPLCDALASHLLVCTLRDPISSALRLLSFPQALTHE